MRYRVLGKTGIRVSEIGLGTWSMGGPCRMGGREIGWGPVDDATSLRTLGAALDLGVNFFDTADVYGAGHSEELLGRAFASRRDDVVLATKFGNRELDNGEWIKDFSEAWIRRSLEHSLRRLRTDYVDVYELHSPFVHSVIPEETWQALEQLKAEGKIRSYGISVAASSPHHGVETLQAGKPEMIQVVYNLLERDVERELLPLALRRQVGAVARVPLASGFLSGRYGKQTRFPADDWRSQRFQGEALTTILDRVEKLRRLALSDRTLAQAALLFCLAHPAISTVIPGARTPDQVREAVAALSAPPFDADDLKNL